MRHVIAGQVFGYVDGQQKLCAVWGDLGVRMYAQHTLQPKLRCFQELHPALASSGVHERHELARMIFWKRERTRGAFGYEIIRSCLVFPYFNPSCLGCTISIFPSWSYLIHDI